jgi:tripartite-type tricarboxylate transporter receptor subunit TctC
VLAVIRGDADITWGSFESLQQYIDSGDLKLVVYYDSKRHPSFKDVPIPAEVGMPELNESMNSHRLIGAPPGLPANVRTVLETAIKKAVEDPEFANAVKKMKRTPAYLDGKQSGELVTSVLRSYETYADIVKALLSQDKQ